jgi:hypothetical protein
MVQLHGCDHTTGYLPEIGDAHDESSGDVSKRQQSPGLANFVSETC